MHCQEKVYARLQLRESSGTSKSAASWRAGDFAFDNGESEFLTIFPKEIDARRHFISRSHRSTTRHRSPIV